MEYHAKLVSLESDEAVTADVAALHPGPIDNSSLLAAGNGALSKEAAPWSHELAVNMCAPSVASIGRAHCGRPRPDAA